MGAKLNQLDKYSATKRRKIDLFFHGLLTPSIAAPPPPTTSYWDARKCSWTKVETRVKWSELTHCCYFTLLLSCSPHGCVSRSLASYSPLATVFTDHERSKRKILVSSSLSLYHRFITINKAKVPSVDSLGGGSGQFVHTMKNIGMWA